MIGFSEITARRWHRRGDVQPWRLDLIWRAVVRTPGWVALIVGPNAQRLGVHSREGMS
jgi:hypothetical protein